MTIDSVVQKTAISLGVVVVAALATWILTPEITSTRRADLGPLFAALTIGSSAPSALSLVNSFKRVVSPALVIGLRCPRGRGARRAQQARRRQFSTERQHRRCRP